MKRNVLLLLLVFGVATFLGCSSESKTLKAAPGSLDFDQVFIGDAKNIQLTLTNKYGKLIQISTIAISGSSDFTIVSGGATPVSLDKNEELIVEVKFEPLTPGDLDALLTINHDGSTKPKEINCEGEGVAVPRIELSDKTYDFGIVYVSVTATHDFEVTNIGTSLLSVSSLTLSGASANLYQISAGAAPFQIAPGAKHTFTLEFSPLADGKFPVSLDLVHDAVNEPSTMNITIDGEGVTFAPEIKFSETSTWDIGTHSNAAPSVHDLVITSDGVDPLTISGATFVTGTTFSVQEFQDKNANVVNLPQTIQVGDTLTVKIEFAPTANQVYNDTLTISHDGINEVTPYDFKIEGTGRDPIVKVFSYTGAIENWQVPAGVTKVTIETWGAQGGNASNLGGKGAYMKGDFVVTPGDTLKILVGERGDNGVGGSTYIGGGGGGGTFVCKSNNDPLIIAGGGGGFCNWIYNPSTPTHHGRITTDGGDTYNNGGGTNGNGGDYGISDGPAAGGGGLLSDGKNYSNYCYGGKSFLNGGAGGKGYGSGSYYGGDGGFGGGGGGWHNSINRSGGGGGYSGGQGGSCSAQAAGGGGGSINNGTNKASTAGVKTDNGEVKITY